MSMMRMASGVRAKSGALHTTYRFTGQRWDSATALYYYGARWYDATIGRFVQADTIGARAGRRGRK